MSSFRVVASDLKMLRSKQWEIKVKETAIEVLEGDASNVKVAQHHGLRVPNIRQQLLASRFPQEH